MSLMKKLKETLEEAPIEMKYPAACFLIANTNADIKKISLQYGLRESKLRKLIEQRKAP